MSRAAARRASRRRRRRRSAGRPALILYTSGSTSYPKAVPLLHHQIIENGFNIGERQGLTPRIACCSPRRSSGRTARPTRCSATLGHGATLVLQGRFDAAESLDLIENERCTALYTMPGMTTAMSHAQGVSPRAHGPRCAPAVTIGTPQDVATVRERARRQRDLQHLRADGIVRQLCRDASPLAAGAAHAGAGAAITRCVDPHRRRRDAESGSWGPDTNPGQIEVKGNPDGRATTGSVRENNAQAFTADGYFRTGDMGPAHARGRRAVPRAHHRDDQARGINIAPAEVEEVLRTHPDVAEAAWSVRPIRTRARSWSRSSSREPGRNSPRDACGALPRGSGKLQDA
jgi:fatty-acyl-CoA synthase